jgi:hypothetical protein
MALKISWRNGGNLFNGSVSSMNNQQSNGVA